MEKKDIIERLQDLVRHNRINATELEAECAKHKIDMYADVLEPMDYNTCERCRAICESQGEMVWLDASEFSNDLPKERALKKAMQAENADYCAICYDCYDELIEKGKEND